jgi:predicted O-methyltransferase YrrM
MSRLTAALRALREKRSPVDPVDPRWVEWFAGKDFSTDWTSAHFPSWTTVVASLNPAARILEVGSWEGRSAIFFLHALREGHITCIDSFEGGAEHRSAEGLAGSLVEVERRFDSNLAEFGSRVRKIKAGSALALAGLSAEQSRFDLAYIDGSHQRDDVLVDSLLAWPMIEKGGLVIWDDYGWRPDLPPEGRPKQAIDWFLSSRTDLTVLRKSYQVIVRKTG